MLAAEKTQANAAKSGKGEVPRRSTTRGAATKMDAERPRGVDKAVRTFAMAKFLENEEKRKQNHLVRYQKLDIEARKQSKISKNAFKLEDPEALFGTILRYWPQLAATPGLALKLFDKQIQRTNVASPSKDRVRLCTIRGLAKLTPGREVEVNAVLDQVTGQSAKARKLSQLLCGNLATTGVIANTIEHFKAEAAREKKSDRSLNKFMSREERVAIMRANKEQRTAANGGLIDGDADEVESMVDDSAFDMDDVLDTVPVKPKRAKVHPQRAKSQSKCNWPFV